MKTYKYDDNDDQRFWTQILNRPELIKLDYDNNLFLNTYKVDIEDIIIQEIVVIIK